MDKFLSIPRRDSFENFFQTTSLHECQGVYRWHQSVASAFFAVMNDFEIALRNTIHFALSNEYDTSKSNSFDWLGVAVIATGKSPNNIPHQLNGKKNLLNGGGVKYTGTLGKIQDAISSLQQNGKAVSVDAVVAEMTFAFWPVVLDKLRHNSHNSKRNQILVSMFPNAPIHDISFLDLITKLLNQIRLLRNRLGHHDSLLKLKEVDAFGNANFIPKKPRHTINSLACMMRNMKMILNWIDTGFSIRLEKSEHWHRLEMLLNVDVLGYYRYDKGTAGCYIRAINYCAEVKRSKCFQAKKKYRRAKYPAAYTAILSYPH